jgi:multidrug efflux pump
MRLWLNPDLMFSRGLTADDVVSAVQAQNVQVAPGSIGAEPARSKTEFQFILNTKGRLITPEQFSKIILKRGGNGELVYLRDVARLELGGQSYTRTGYQDGVTPAVTIGILQLPGSNELKTAALVKKQIAEMAKSFPTGMEYTINYDPTLFTQQSIDAVYETLPAAVILVVIVVMVFLQSWRIAVIPLIAVPVSLIGTFAVMAFMGFLSIHFHCSGSYWRSASWSMMQSWWSRTWNDGSSVARTQKRQPGRRWMKWAER